ncbi:DUF7146 domain-containing protein [Sphingosinicella terrae]|uniref:DUF7146 domain-containing protein n=1 Tax=Sphingosinicella terrae TaxID=2172047 RepID=UPI000E0D819F|nr:toprim domain-containing protein [Sphingosinicella terrae]
MSLTDGPGGLEAEARALVERLGGRWGRGGGMCRCPAHDDRRPSLSIRPGRRRLLLHCFAGCRADEILRAFALAGHFVGRASRASGESGAGSDGKPDCGPPRAVLRLWGAARPLPGTVAELYLERRGLRTGTDELRFHPRTPHGPRPLTRFRPALLAAVRDETGIVALHRTFLDPAGNGLAAIDPPRCGLGRFGSGAVRLGGLAPRLGLAEGIETAMSASHLFRMPCWATLGTERFGRVALPHEVGALVLFLDHDAGGCRAEALAREAYAHLDIEVRRPRLAGADWNDVLRAMRRLRA